MFPTTSGGTSFTVALADEQATHRLMVHVASIIEPGDLIRHVQMWGDVSERFTRSSPMGHAKDLIRVDTVPRCPSPPRRAPRGS